MKKLSKIPKWAKIVLGIVAFIIVISLFSNPDENNKEQNAPKNEYKIVFLSDGKKVKEYTIQKGELITPPETPVKENYTFSHWATHQKSTDGSEKFDFSKAPENDTTLFAHYTYTPKENASTNYNYESIYNEYSSRLKKECPKLSMTECAELANEGTEKMAEYMYSAKGTDGQYATYEKWAGKLYDIYLKEAK